MVIGLNFPAGPRGVYRVNLREAGDTTSRSGTAVFIDPRSQAVVHRMDRATRPGGDSFLLWVRILHEGGAFGGVGRFVTFLGGLMPPLLMVTGPDHVAAPARPALVDVGDPGRRGIRLISRRPGRRPVLSIASPVTR